MEQLARKYPEDKEASIFYALALLEAVDHGDKTYARQLKAGAILEPIDRQQPEHPGLTHYIIHTYDFEPLAQRGLAAADKYAKVAPSAPHAQHMPSHIYSILGKWDDSIRSNQAAVKASREYAAKNAPGTTFSQEPHAQDFMAYAYLQLGRDRDAKRVVEELAVITNFSGGRNYGRDTGTVAPASRYVLERAAWSEAAGLAVPQNLYTYAEAMPRFTRAVGAAKTGDLGMARNEIEQLQALSKRAENSYWAEQIQVLVLAASGWRAGAESRNDDALKFMRAAADLEDSTEKHVSMENRIYPMREMLGNLLMELGQPAAALQAYEASLHVAQNRLRGLYGAAKAAQAAGDQAKARAYFEKLATLGRNADPERAEVLEAKAFVLAQR
jgi:tetratricopeptide (TPR) repeat protein